MHVSRGRNQDSRESRTRFTPGILERTRSIHNDEVMNVTSFDTNISSVQFSHSVT